MVQSPTSSKLIDFMSLQIADGGVAGVSVSQLHALFRSELGTTPRAWLGELRLKRVAEQLAQTDLPIAELAYRGGYSDQSALTRAMKRATGLTPAAYRRRCREMRPLQQQIRSKIL